MRIIINKDSEKVIGKIYDSKNTPVSLTISNNKEVVSKEKEQPQEPTE